MKRLWESPWPPAILLLCLLALGTLAIRERSELVRVRLDFKVTDQATQSRLANLRQQLASAQAAQAKTEKLAAARAPKAAGDGEVRTIRLSDIVNDHPEYAAILAKQERRSIMWQFGPAFASLNLRPDQLAKMKDLLVERDQTRNDARQAADAAGLDQSSPAYRAAVKQATDVVDQQMTQVLGTDGSAAIRKLQTASNAQQQISYNYAPTFADAGAPLTPEQNQGLAHALVATRDYSTIPPAALQNFFKTDPATGLSPADSRMLDAAAQVLSPVQLQALKTYQMQSNQESAILNPYYQSLKGSNAGISIEP